MASFTNSASSSSRSANPRVAKLLEKHDDDVVITLAVRSPLCKSRKGGFKDAGTDELLTEIFRAVVQRGGFDPVHIEDICVGNVLTPKPVYEARMAALTAGIPETTAIQVINRFCSSGLMAVNTIATQIKSGQIEVGLAIGAESMSIHADSGSPPANDEFKAHPTARDVTMAMGWTSENVARDFNITRESMDAAAARSFNSAEKAQKAGYFESEIVPLTVTQIDPKTKEKRKVVVNRDDGIRYGTTAEGLGKVRPAFPQWGNWSTGGNSSQITDGVAAVLMMRRSKARALGVPIIGKHVTTATVGLAPRIMGIGPALAIPKALKLAGLEKDDVDVFEVNEAWASMYVYVLDKLQLDPAKVNVFGGAIALGHPLGCTGARQVATGFNVLKKTGGRILVTSMCIGSGMGAAGVFVNEQ